MRLAFAARLAFIAWIALISSVVRAAEGSPGIFGVYSEAFLGSSYAVAPGSVILIFSGDVPIGPSVAQLAAGFPLTTNLAGASVTVKVSDTSVSALILAAEAHWLRALLPAGTPLGDGSLVVTYNGRVTDPYRIRVVERRFGIYDGSWCGPSAFSTPPGFCVPRAVQNLSSGGALVNTFLTPARPGQLVALWGTGLGFASGDETSGPIPGNLQVPGLQVIVGNKQARLVYAGRSGCCAGMDEILFEVPEGIEGCNVPAWVRFSEDGSATNDVFVSISSGQVCSDPQGLSEPEIRTLVAGNLKAAQISATEGSPGNWGALFGAAVATPVIPFGTCQTYTWGGPFTVAVPLDSLKDAGAILALQTPGARLVAARKENNIYSGDLDGRLEAGQYVIDNAAGGSGVAPFRSTFSIPPRTFVWSNRDTLTDLTAGRDAAIAWSAAGSATGYVLISGLFGADGEYSGGFLCYERPDKGAFVVPSAVIERFRTGSADSTEVSLSVAYVFLARIVIPGFDVAEIALRGPPEIRIVNLK